IGCGMPALDFFVLGAGGLVGCALGCDAAVGAVADPVGAGTFGAAAVCCSPCLPTTASPGFNLRQQPLTMSPCGRFTCAEYGYVSPRIRSWQAAFVIVPESAKLPFI